MKQIGGALCLDFCNTVGGRRDGGVLADHLKDYGDLAHWSQDAGLLSPREAQDLLTRAAANPEQARRALAHARDLRETLYRIFSAQAIGKAFSHGDLDQFNSFLVDALRHALLVKSHEGIVWAWQEAESRLDRMLWSITRSAADLLTSEQLMRVRECSGDDCSWLFVDTSKNHSRRWCDMSDCGNRAKARRHYARAREKNRT